MSFERTGRCDSRSKAINFGHRKSDYAQRPLKGQSHAQCNENLPSCFNCLETAVVSGPAAITNHDFVPRPPPSLTEMISTVSRVNSSFRFFTASTATFRCPCLLRVQSRSVHIEYKCFEKEELHDATARNYFKFWNKVIYLLWRFLQRS